MKRGKRAVTVLIVLLSVLFCTTEIDTDEKPRCPGNDTPYWVRSRNDQSRGSSWRWSERSQDHQCSTWVL